MMNIEQTITDALGDDSQITYEELEAVLSPAQLHTLAIRCADTKDTLVFDEAAMHDNQTTVLNTKMHAKLRDARKKNFYVPIRETSDE